MYDSAVVSGGDYGLEAQRYEVALEASHIVQIRADVELGLIVDLACGSQLLDEQMVLVRATPSLI